jgi:hypothetical protein
MDNPNRDHPEIDTSIDKRDFGTNWPLLVDGNGFAGHRRPRSESSGISPLDNGSEYSDGGLLSDVEEGIVEEDRRKLKLETVRVCSFILGVVSW